MDNKRKNVISLRLTDKELELIRELAYQARLSLSAYIRAQVFTQEEGQENE